MYQNIPLYLGLILLVVLRRQEVNWKEKLGIKKDLEIKKELVTGVKYFFIMLGAGIAVSAVFTFLEPGGLEPTTKMLLEINSFAMFGILILASFSEEVFFRGFIQKNLGIPTMMLIFIIFHLGYGTISQLAGAGVLGLILGLEYRKSKGITAPFITHLLYNSFAFGIRLIFI